ncbi:MAG: hypothetical protein M3Z64_09780, partial [Verrucomicrobiota bacterium]|nr:hypothetical protein [Verrucomicrobiota bacterium]
LIVAAIGEQRTRGVAGDPIYQGRSVAGGGSGLRLPPLMSIGPGASRPNSSPPPRRPRKPQSQDTAR